MRMRNRILTGIVPLFLVISLLLSSCVVASLPDENESLASTLSQPENAITLISEHDGNVVQLNDEVITAYWTLPFDESFAYLRANCTKETGKEHDGQTFCLEWEGSAPPYTVFYGDNEALSGATEVKTDGSRLLIGTLLPNTKYWWKVTDANGESSETGSFVTSDGPRLISMREDLEADGAKNFRDLGGYQTVDGKTVKYGLLYRGAMLEYPNDTNGNYRHDVVDDYGREVINSLGINIELDLRNDSDYGGQTESAIEGAQYLRLYYTGYASIFPDSTYPDTVYYDPITPMAFKIIFATLSKEESYPLYFHCLVGQDRTGTLSYLILGLLGVDFEDITRDYELTAFSKVGKMDRELDFYFTAGGKVRLQPRAWNGMNDIMMEYYGTESGLLKDAVANYLMTECGVSEEEIESIRNILLS